MSKRIVLLAALAMPACSDQIRPAEYDDLGKIVGAGLVTPDGGGDLNAIADTAMIARGIVPVGFTSDGFMTKGKHGDVSYSYAVMCDDASGRPLARCGSQADRAFVIASWDGSVEMSSFAMVTRRQGTWSLSGVASPIALATGSTSLMDQEATFRRHSYRMTDSVDLRTFVDMARQDMMGGTMTREIDVTQIEGDWSRDYTVIADVTVVSAHLATITLDGTYDYNLDLATGELTYR